MGRSGKLQEEESWFLKHDSELTRWVGQWQHSIWRKKKKKRVQKKRMLREAVSWETLGEAESEAASAESLRVLGLAVIQELSEHTSSLVH